MASCQRLSVICRIVGLETHTGSANARGYNLDNDVVAGEMVGLGGGALLGDAILLAFEDGEGNHVGCFRFILIWM